MKKATKAEVRKAASLLKRLHDLQFDIYSFASHFDDRGFDQWSVLATESGFELDISHEKMDELRKQLQASNYGPQ